jgi:hypothetical protein
VVTDPERVAAVTAEAKRRLAYLEQQYRFERRFGFDARTFNASLKRLRKPVQQPAIALTKGTRLHPFIELCITRKAKEFAGLSTDENLGETHADCVAEAVRRVAAELKVVRGAPANVALRRYVEGLMVVMQDATGLPVIATRYKQDEYDPQVPGSRGEVIRLLVDRLEPGISNIKLSNFIREARKKYAGKPMRFCDLFPGYGMVGRSDGAPVSSPTHQIEHFEMTSPIYCP